VFAVAGISAALSAGNAITDAFDQARREAAAIEQDQARLDSLFAKRDGHIEPFQHHDLDLARDLQKPRTIIDAAEVAANVPSRAFFYLLPGALFLLVYARFIYVGYHFFFSRHSIEAAGGQALRAGALFDLQKVREAFKVNPGHLFNPPPLHESLSRLRRGKAFREKTELDADLAKVMMRRDRAHAAKLEAEAELRAMKQKLPWWRRWW
jgi:hypothetical protein